MSIDTLHVVANSDTPAAVEVPKTMSALAVWAVGRFGGIIVATLFAAYAAHTLWMAHTVQTERMFVFQERRVDADLRLAEAISSIREQRSTMDLELMRVIASLKTTIEDVARQAARAHQQPP